MKTQALPTLRLSRHTLLPRSFQQRRWAQVHDVRFLATHSDPRHVLERYRAKLDQKAKHEGHDSIESLKEAYQDKINDLHRETSAAIPPQSSSPGGDDQTQAQVSHQESPAPPLRLSHAKAIASATKSSKTGGIKPLSSYLDVEKVRSLPARELEAIWRLRHAKDPLSICACIPVETYRRIAAAARQNPQFILPLPRQQTDGKDAVSLPSDGSGNNSREDGMPIGVGADIHFLQWAFHPPPSPSPSHGNTHVSTVIFTHLAAYKAHGAYAQPHTTLTHHLDLAQEKGVVLMHGQVMPDSGVSVTEANWLASCVQRFYDFGGQAEGRKGELVRMFTKGDVEGFKVEALLDEVQKL